MNNYTLYILVAMFYMFVAGGTYRLFVRNLQIEEGAGVMSLIWPVTLPFAFGAGAIKIIKLKDTEQSLEKKVNIQPEQFEKELKELQLQVEQVKTILKQEQQPKQKKLPKKEEKLQHGEVFPEKEELLLK